MGISSEEKKSIGVSAALSTLASAAAVLTVLWVVVKPVMVGSISEAMGTDVEQQIERKLEPLNAGFKAILQQNINSLRRQIAAMKFHQAQFPQEWTEVDAATLAQMEIDLDGQVAAYRAVVAAER